MKTNILTNLTSMKNLKRLSLIWILLLSAISFTFATSPNATIGAMVQNQLDCAVDGQVIYLPEGYIAEVLHVRNAVVLSPAKGSILKGLILDATNKAVLLSEDLVIDGTLEFRTGVLHAQGHNVKAKNTINVYDASYMMMGTLTISVPPNTTVNFPIGTMAGMADVDVIGNPTHTTDDITCSVVDRNLITDFSNPDPAGPRFAKFEWDISELVIGGSNVNFVFRFPTDPNNVQPSKAVLGHLVGGSWSYVNTTVSGAGPFATSAEGPYTTFSPFGVFGSLPVHNITQNTFYATIQAAVNAANPNDVIECDPAVYDEKVVIDRSLTLQGVDSSTVILDGTGLGVGNGTAGNGSGIVINVGVIKEMRIQKNDCKKLPQALHGNRSAAIFATIAQIMILPFIG